MKMMSMNSRLRSRNPLCIPLSLLFLFIVSTSSATDKLHLLEKQSLTPSGLEKISRNKFDEIRSSMTVYARAESNSLTALLMAPLKTDEEPQPKTDSNVRERFGDTPVYETDSMKAVFLFARGKKYFMIPVKIGFDEPWPPSCYAAEKGGDALCSLVGISLEIKQEKGVGETVNFMIRTVGGRSESGWKVTYLFQKNRILELENNPDTYGYGGAGNFSYEKSGWAYQDVDGVPPNEYILVQSFLSVKEPYTMTSLSYGVFSQQGDNITRKLQWDPGISQPDCPTKEMTISSPEWKSIPALQRNVKSAVHWKPERWKGKSDLSFQVRACSAKGLLYVMTEVTDDKLVYSHEKDIFKDHIEIEVSFSSDKIKLDEYQLYERELEAEIKLGIMPFPSQKVVEWEKQVNTSFGEQGLYTGEENYFPDLKKTETTTERSELGYKVLAIITSNKETVLTQLKRVCVSDNDDQAKGQQKTMMCTSPAPSDIGAVIK